MQKIIAFSALLSLGLFLTAIPVLATGSFSTPPNLTTAQTLTDGQTGTIASGSDLKYTSGTDNTAITISGTSATGSQIVITNSGFISTGKATTNGRAIQDKSGGSNTLITNNANALIQSAGDDTIAVNVNKTTGVTNSVIDIENKGTIQSLDGGGTGSSTVPTAAGNQAINLSATTGSNIVNNFSTGVIWATAADAVRPGLGGVVHNDGLIYSNAYLVPASGSTPAQYTSSDGVEVEPADNNVTIVNGYTTNPGTHTATYQGAITGYVGNLTGYGTSSSDVSGKQQSTIEGGRHGISGGAEVNTSDSDYDEPFALNVTNNGGAIIQGDDGSGINIDGVDATEVVTVTNYGSISGNGTTRDGDGIDVDGILNLTNYAGGSIVSKNAYQDGSEGLTVGGGTILNFGKIEGSNLGGTSSFARGITLAGIDHTTSNNAQGVETDTPIPVEKIYANTIVHNYAGGVIQGDSDSGIAILGVNNTPSGNYTATNYSVTITNDAGATIEGAGATAVIDGSATASVSGTNGAVGTIGTASANNETVINSGTIQENGTGAAISLGSGTNSVQILGGAASINGDISGGTSAGSNTLTIDPTSGQSFSYSHVLSNFNSVNLKSGTITLSGASTYTGTTTVSGGTSYINNTSGSGTGTGAVGVSQGAVLAGNGIIQPGSGNGVTLANGGTLSSGGPQPTPGANGSSTAVVGTGLTLDNTVAKGTILDASVGGAGGAKLAFALGAGTYGVNLTSTYLNVVDDGGADTLGELKFASNDTITLDDLTNGALQFSINTPYILIKATNDADYAGLTTTGDINGQTNQDGYVTTNINIVGNVGGYSGLKLYLANGALEVVPEPGTWAMMFGGLCVLIFIQTRRRGLKS